MSYCSNPFVKTKELGRLSATKNTKSLFYALELARCYQLIDSNAARKRFDRLLNAEGKTEELAMGLIERAGIGGKSYGTAHLNLVQKYWDQEYPEMFRIVAFNMKSGLNPIFKGENVRKYEVCVILDNGHWDAHKKIRPLPRYRIVVYDLETTVVNGEHTPNLVSAARTCSVCVGADKECEICRSGPKMIT
uniref:Exonuclease domain-containing protein n=1 Tax=Globodera rostochiensis TaxID=31243 RepID=A0A914HR54_GLORO